MESQHANWTDPMINGWFSEQQIEGWVRFHLKESSLAKPKFETDSIFFGFGQVYFSYSYKFMIAVWKQREG